MKLVREHLFEDEEYKPVWIKPSKSSDDLMRELDDKPIEYIAANLDKMHQARINDDYLYERFNELSQYKDMSVKKIIAILNKYTHNIAGSSKVSFELKNFIVKKLKELLSKEPKNFDYVFRRAIEFDSFELSKNCIEKGADPAMNYNWPIQIASRHGNVKLVKYLLTIPEVDPSGQGYTTVKQYKSSSSYDEALRDALAANKPEVVKILLKDKRVIDKMSKPLKKQVDEYLAKHA